MRMPLRKMVSRLPKPIQMVIRRLFQKTRLLTSLFYRGNARSCSVCGFRARKFLDAGAITRKGAMCPRCGSLERQRLSCIFLSQKTSLLDKRDKHASTAAPKLLHVGLEACLEQRFRETLGDGYLSADLHNPIAMASFDICEIPHKDQSFDAIYCSHVLEHVQDDVKAMKEFHRVLKNDGWAILLVPISAKKTIEDPTITDPKERLRLYGQEDHVRRYGPDYIDRLREAGFNVDTFKVSDLVTHDEAIKMGLERTGGRIVFCTKRELVRGHQVKELFAK